MSNPYGNPHGDVPPPPPNPYMTPQYGPYSGPPSPHVSYAPPNRGPLVLTLGIIGLVVTIVGSFACSGIAAIFGLALSIPAWIIAQSDMRAIARGQKDANGRGLVMGGLVTGIIGTVVGGLVILAMIVVVIILFAVVAAAPEP